MDDDEVPTAEPAANVGDRGQRALRDRVIRRLDASGAEAQAFDEAREGQKIRAVALKCSFGRELRKVERATVVGRDGRERRQAAVVAPALTDEGEISRRG